MVSHAALDRRHRPAIYPGVVAGLAQGHLFIHAANGSLLCNAQGQVVGSEQIGQYWTDLEYFHGRPSVTVEPIDRDAQTLDAARQLRRPRVWAATDATLEQDAQQRVAA